MIATSAGILSTGSEILEGLYADTNAAWLSERLTEAGLNVVLHVAAPDSAASVAEALRYLARNCRVVIMTGGLGPTEDDLTRAAVCKVFGVGLAEDPRAWAMIVERFARRGMVAYPSNRVQCMIPKTARTLYNEWGTAPGFVIERPRKGLPWFAALPGPPREMRPMFLKYLREEITRRFGRGLHVRIRTLHTFGHPESQLNDTLRDLFAETRGDPTRAIALLAADAKVDVRLVARGGTSAQARRRIDSLAARVRRLVSSGAVYGEDDETLESVVSGLLRNKGMKIALAESCTGGLIAKRLTDIPGSSDILIEGWVTYADEAKKARLGVREASLERHGAVSSKVVEEMAVGALRRSGADIAVSVSGIAGPTGGSAEKPIGTVWYGLAWREALLPPALLRAALPHAALPRAALPRAAALRQEPLRAPQSPATIPCNTRAGVSVVTTRTVFPSGRDMVRAFAAHRALDLVRRLLLGLPLEFGDWQGRG